MKKRVERAFNLKAYIVSVLRRASYRSKARNEVFRAARRGRNTYLCTKCKALRSRKETAIDHIQPVVPITGWVSWDNYIERLFCEKEGLQSICTTCHKAKSKIENAARRLAVKEKKNGL